MLKKETNHRKAYSVIPYTSSSKTGKINSLNFGGEIVSGRGQRELSREAGNFLGAGYLRVLFKFIKKHFMIWVFFCLYAIPQEKSFPKK